jgi:peptide subunit release factor 1 (eRF1)
VFEQGELIDHTERLDRLPRHDDDQGDWDHDHVRDHLAAAAHAHLRRAAELAFAVFQDRPFDHLVLAGPGEVVAAVEPELHSYLRERVNGRATLPVSASVAEIGRASDEMAEQIERATEAALVRRLLDRAAAGNGSVTGLDAVLAALGERRVDTLVVSDRFVVGGWRCFGCDCVARRGPLCAACTQPMVRVDDVVEEAVELALLQSCRVVTCMGNPDLDVHGRVGALLRF